MKVKCIKVTPKNTYGKYDDITVGKIYEAFKDGDFLIVEDDKGDLWDYEAELFELVKEVVEEVKDDEAYIMDFIKANKLDYFTGNVIKCMIKFNQTQDKQYLADSLKFIEMMA